MEQLLAYLGKYGHLTVADKDLLASLIQPFYLEKGQYFVESGRVCARLGFISDGVCRSCYYDKLGNDFTRYFIYEGRFVGDVNGYLDQSPALEYIEAITDCTLLTLNRADFAILETSIVGWSAIFAKLNAQVLENKMKMASNMLVQDAHTRYLNFLDHYLGLGNRVPQSMLASFLGITPSSLSRIRRQVK
ncbi:Crp/Fnr family transcriptional regulator [Sphingobacterium bambusae]|uniref:Crp/Fnr family transcriptional regulator n=1 Tax=Sphingobacterium bambusae TaxID=662858 RepID=A0ABW6BI33_9SPHI|nr:Crp/Fnr family transcriptional regulator [Sphingobacterium bambusae]WPL50087.1 Crp/Fnr family transcriptional regulator [Sphingobacterium bambusae]